MPIVPGSDSIVGAALQQLPIVELGSLDELWFQVAGTHAI